MVERARIILACLDGEEIQRVAQELGTSIPTVSKWRMRFSQHGLSKPSFGITMNGQSRFVGASARSREVNPEIPLLTYAIRH